MTKTVRLLTLAAAMLMTLAARADEWPSRLIKATIPFGAGSATDVVPRLFFERLSTEIGQPVVVENRPGAGGTVGTAAIAKAEPDGYNVLAHSSAITIAPALFPNLPYDTVKDLAGVLMIGSSANVMIVPAERGWTSVADFIAAAKAKPGSISYGSVGIGSATHISAEKFRRAAGIEATHVPYRGGSEVIADILGGRIDYYFCPLATALPLIRQGQVKALVISSGERSRDLPDVPTPTEAGLKDAETKIWFGVFAPAKTPGAIIEKFHAVGEKVLGDPATRQALQKLGVEPMPMSPAQIDALVARETTANMALFKDVQK